MLSAALLLSAAGLGARLLEYRRAADEYSAIAKQMEAGTPPSPPPAGEPAPGNVPLETTAEPQPSEPPVPAMTPAFIENRELIRLKAQNRDTVGYLDIEDTGIHYPVVHTTDNTYYQSHTFLRKKNASGAIFLDSANNTGLDDFNLVLYGHHMKDGSMFHDLLQYGKAAFAGAHRIIHLTAPSEKMAFYVFSAYACGSGQDMRGFQYATETQRQAFIGILTGRSDISAGTAVFPLGCQLLTLVTCRENVAKDFFVVHAVRIE